MNVSVRPDKGQTRLQVWSQGALYGWADTVVLGQPSEGPDDLASARILIPIRWNTNGTVVARGHARMFYGYVPKRGRELPPPECLFRRHEITVESLVQNGWWRVLPGADAERLPRHSGILSPVLGCWAINDRRLA